MILAFLVSVLAADVTGGLSKQIHHSGLDAQQCYRIRDLRFARDEIKLYLSDGYLIFGQPVNGTRISAVFSAATESGDAELLLLPPLASERRTLAAYAKSPNLVEHFKEAAFIFSDETGAELMKAVQELGGKPSAEMGALLATKWSSTTSLLAASFEVRLVEDLLSPRRASEGFLFAAIAGNTLGSFDLVWDSRARHQILMGQVAYREDRRYFDIWTNFEAQSWRTGRRRTSGEKFRIEQVAIDAAIERDLTLTGVTKLRLTPLDPERIIAVELSPRMRVEQVTINGQPAEWFSPESLRANLLRGNENQTTLLTTGTEFPAGVPIEVEVKHQGKVIVSAEEKIYFVGERGAWYPNRTRQFAPYEVKFRHPKELDLVATGELVSEAVEGEWKISRRKTSAPVRFFGFNLGEYDRTVVKRGRLTVEVCANQKLERALQPKARPVEIASLPSGPVWPRGGARRAGTEIVLLPAPVTNPVSRLQKLAEEMAGIFEDLSARLGQPPLETLTVSPIPGRFGQGFPGLVYLSTIAYLDPRELPATNTAADQTFFAELLHAHEIAHQWWGNGVTSADYQDDWLMEALANYSAVWMLEKRKGSRNADQVLDQYKAHLLRKADDGRTIESMGPVTMGHRLYSSQAPAAWSVVTYQKGAWILHMLRRRIGDAGFQKMLARLYEQYRFQPVTTAQFQALAAAQLAPKSADPKLDLFFEQWVDGTGIPDLKLSWKVSGRAPKLMLTGTVTQTQVDENFSALVPVEVQVPRARPIVKWVQTSSEPVTFSLPLAAAPARVVLNPGNAVLAR